MGFVRFVGFAEDNENYYLFEEYGGISLMTFLKQSFHKPNFETYNMHIQYIIQILVNTLYYLHCHCSLCHLDLSLENVVINPKTKIVKICDFGLSLFFNKQQNTNQNTFLCTQYCGKPFYAAPEVVSKRPFDARLADVWALGVILFTMLCCVQPFSKADLNDERFDCIMDGKMNILLDHWGMQDYIPEDAKDLLNLIFKYENERTSIDKIIFHKYVRNAPIIL